MLTCGEEYPDQGLERYEDQQCQPSIAALERPAAAHGFQVPPVDAAA
jgi:hypothetical protein